jgi:hypothetical protein
MDKVSSQLKLSNQVYLDNLEKAFIDISTSFNLKITSDEISFITSFVDKQILGMLTPIQFTQGVTTPTIDEVIQQQNLSASKGLPYPWIKKREMVPHFRYWLTKFFNKTLSVYDLNTCVYPFSAAFRRYQITNSGLKARLVFAVEAITACLESYFDMIFKRALLSHKFKCNIIHGYRQPEIAEVCNSFVNYHCYSCDVSGFDNSLHSKLLILSFEYFSHCTLVFGYNRKILNYLRNNFLTLPVFHPSRTFTP